MAEDATKAEAAGPLHGFRIVDLTSAVSGPLATMLLADQGADVIKVENPAGGDYTRQVSAGRGGFSASFLNNNRGKRSLALDLKHPRGREVLGRLVERADVLVQNFRPGVVERMGIGEGWARGVAPRLVYVSIDGFGARGPYAGRPVYDPLVQALSGLTSVQAGSDSERPRLVRTILPDKLTGAVAAQAITAALLARARTGKGQHVRLSMLDAVLDFLWHSDMGGQTFVGDEAGAEDEGRQSFIDLIYATADGHIAVAVQTDRQWAGLTRAVERPDWLDDERFRTPALRQRNIDARLTLTQDALRAGDSATWLERLDGEGVPCAPVLRRRDVIAHPQVLANETLVEVEHPRAGRLRQTRPAARFSAGPLPIGRGAPGLGEHNREVLAEAGYDDDAIAGLRAAGAVGGEGEGKR